MILAMATHRIAQQGFVIGGQPVPVGTLVDEANMSPFAVRTMEESGLIVRLEGEPEVEVVTPEVVSEIVDEVADETVEVADEVAEVAPVKKAPAKKATAKKATAPKK